MESLMQPYLPGQLMENSWYKNV